MLFMTACTPREYLVVYNNTSSDIWITFSYEEFKNSYFLKSKEKLELEDYMGKDVSISCNDNVTKINYRGEDLPKDFWVPGGIACYEICFQIEPDWNIYILKDNNFPANKFPPQPEGYPLKPVSKTVFQQTTNLTH